MNGEQGPSLRPAFGQPDEQAVLWRSGFMAVERSARILTTSAANGGSVELVSAEKRYIIMPSHLAQAELHAALSQEYLPVFAARQLDEQFQVFDVPPGTMSMRQVVRLAGRDPMVYGEIFRQAGEIAGHLQASGFGLPRHSKPERALDGMAFALLEDHPYGGTVYLAPPYNLDPYYTYAQLLDGIAQQLGESPYVSDVAQRMMLNDFVGGWHAAA